MTEVTAVMGKFLYVFSEDLKNELIQSGFVLIEQIEDINGAVAWVIDPRGFSFNINDEKFLGKCSFATKFRLTF